MVTKTSVTSLTNKYPLVLRQWPVVAAAIAVTLITFIVYLPALQNNFVNWDDPEYVYENPNIQSIDYRFLKWSFINAVVSLWHPLTLFSLAIDYAFWGLNPFGYHLTNIIIHALNAPLVFILVVSLLNIHERLSSGRTKDLEFNKKKIFIAFATALLFSIHPIHVESVAWVSERKDILCAFFFLLTLLTYLNYTMANSRRRRAGYYLLCVALFLLALMSKPMAVSLPIVLLLIDFYPLKRLDTRFVLVEKVPFLIFSLISSLITISVHRTGGALVGLEAYPMQMRVFTAVSAYIVYLLKMVLPFNLVPLYPLPEEIGFSGPIFVIPLILLVIITIFCSRSSNKSYLIAWFYYIVTLIPVIGIVKVGSQAMADRYTYLPSLGPFLIAGIGIWALLERYRDKRQHAVAIAAIILVPILFMNKTVRQISIWEDSLTLWSYEIKLFPDNELAYAQRGHAYFKLGNHHQAIRDYNIALKIDPQYAKAYHGRGHAYSKLSDYQQAIRDYSVALEIDPRYQEAYYNRGIAFDKLGEYNRAVADFSRAIKLKPPNVDAYLTRGIVFIKLGENNRAIEDFNKVIELELKSADAYNNRGIAYTELGIYDLAIKDYNMAIKINPRYAGAYFNLGLLYLRLGKVDMARVSFNKAANLGSGEAREYLSKP